MREDLERDLRGLATKIDVPALDVARGVAERLRAGRAPGLRGTPGGLHRALRPVIRPAWHRVVAAAAAFLLVAAGLLGLSSGARDAVADLLGLKGVRIVTVPSLPPVPSSLGNGLQLGDPVSLARARSRVPYPILLPGDAFLGSPDEVFVSEAVPQGQVSLLYAARPGLARAAPTDTGLLLTEFRGQVNREFLEKLIVESTTVRPVTVNGDPGFWIGGHPHDLFYLTPSGAPIMDSSRLAGNVLLWQHGDLTLRLEANVGEAQALGFARSVR
jgi:hypothetical protein